MKKLYTILGLMMLLTISMASAFIGNGAGTVGDPYQITTALEMKDIESEMDAYYILMNDIDLSGGELGHGIGDWNFWDGAHCYKGDFDGQGFSIDGFSYTSDGTYSPGIFSMVCGGTIENVKVSNVNIDGSYAGFAGGLVAYHDFPTGDTYPELIIRNIVLDNVVIDGDYVEDSGLLTGYIHSKFPITIDNIYVGNSRINGDEYGIGIISGIGSEGRSIGVSTFSITGQPVSISNIHMENTIINVDSGSSYSYQGALIGYASVDTLTISNVKLDGWGTVTSPDVGAILGEGLIDFLTLQDIYTDASSVSALVHIYNGTYSQFLPSNHIYVVANSISCSDVYAIGVEGDYENKEGDCDVTYVPYSGRGTPSNFPGLTTNWDYTTGIPGITSALALLVPANTEPIINSITPDTRIELVNGETQLYTADVTDTELDASYSWTLGGIEVSTSETYLADWSFITPGIYTLELEVSDAEYSDTASTTLEIRAKGGSSSGGSSSSLSIVTTQVEDDVVVEDKIEPEKLAGSNFFGRTKVSIGNFFGKIGSWFRGLF